MSENGQAGGETSDSRFGADVLDALDRIACRLDARGRLRDWTERLPSETGYDTADLDGLHVTQLVTDEADGSFSAALRRALETGERQRRTAPLVRSGGETVPYEWTITPVDGERLTLLGRDRTRQTERERRDTGRRAEVRRLERALALLRRVNETVSQARTRTEIESRVVEAIVGEDAFERAVIVDVGPEIERVSIRARAPDERESSPMPTERSASLLASKAFRSGETVVLRPSPDPDSGDGGWSLRASDASALSPPCRCVPTGPRMASSSCTRPSPRASTIDCSRSSQTSVERSATGFTG
ncbi:PAS domain-containing protein [Haloarculaceae archaeon H-GB2-1]|nr:PAS domain-containing protein [Haloarculaceae archaeon H-GB11]MEA5407680.1 PAS domain-containing protein [Haloarculaceae archaeon H-GB2-1]